MDRLFSLWLFFKTVILVQGASISNLYSPDKCAQVSLIDCGRYVPEGNEIVCSTSERTYQNLCFFAQAKCKNSDLNIAHLGHCTSVDHTTDAVTMTTVTNGDDISSTTDPTTVMSTEVSTKDVVYQIFCEHTDSVSCDGHLDPFCGSDGHFYQNSCTFAIAQCSNSSLTAEGLEFCKGSGNK